MSTRTLVGGYVLCAAVLTAGYYAFPGWHMAIWSTIGLSSAAAIVLGVLRNRPRRRAPWLVLAAATLVFAAGDTTYNLLTTVLGQQNPFPSAADGFYLVNCVLQNLGMILLVRSMTAGRDRSSLLASPVAGLASWFAVPRLTAALYGGAQTHLGSGAAPRFVGLLAGYALEVLVLSVPAIMLTILRSTRATGDRSSASTASAPSDY